MAFNQCKFRVIIGNHQDPGMHTDRINAFNKTTQFKRFIEFGARRNFNHNTAIHESRIELDQRITGLCYLTNMIMETF